MLLCITSQGLLDISCSVHASPVVKIHMVKNKKKANTQDKGISKSYTSEVNVFFHEKISKQIICKNLHKNT